MRYKKLKNTELVKTDTHLQVIYDRIRKIIEDARGNIARVVNTEMVTAYWYIGHEIVEGEQKGKSRAEYGQRLIKNLAVRLSDDFGKGFDERNLFFMRQFYLVFPKLNALRSELSWTHYRILMRVKIGDSVDSSFQCNAQ